MPLNSTEVGRVHVDIGADLDNLKKGFDQAKKETDKLGSSIGQKMTQAGKIMTAAGLKMTAAITTPIIAIGKKLVNLGMDAVESENLFTVSMGNMAGAARKWSEDLRESLGLNEYEVRKSVGTLNVMFESMGLGEQAAYDMSTSLTELAYDMASFYNLDPSDAFLKLQAGMTGEAEQLKRLGILVDETTVKEVAYTNGIAKRGEELTAQEKVQARYITIMEATTKAQGDMAATLESPSNQLRILKDEITQTGIEFGTILLPVMSKAIEIIRDITSWLSNLSEEQKESLLKWVGIVAALGPALIIFGQILIVLPKLAAGLKLLSGSLNASLINPYTIALVGIAVAFTQMLVALNRAKKAIRDVHDEIAQDHQEFVQERVDAAVNAVKEEYAEYKKVKEDELALEKETHEAALKAIDEWRSDQIEARKDELQDQKDAAKEALDDKIESLRDEYGVYEKHVDSKMDLVNDFYDEEIRKATEAHDEKIALLEDEYQFQLGLIDREADLNIGFIEDQIALLEGASQESVAIERKRRLERAAIQLEDQIAAEDDAAQKVKLVEEREALIAEMIGLAGIIAAEQARELQKELAEIQAEILAESDPDKKARLVQEEADLVSEIQQLSGAEQIETQKWILREGILAIKQDTIDKKTEAEIQKEEALGVLQELIDEEIGKLEAKRDEELTILEAERQNKEDAETAKYDATVERIDGELDELDRGKGAFIEALDAEVLAKQTGENLKYQATVDRVTAEILELERLEQAEIAAAARSAARAANEDKDQKHKELLDEYMKLNEEYQAELDRLMDRSPIEKALSLLTGNMDGSLNLIEDAMNKIGAQLAAMGDVAFADLAPLPKASETGNSSTYSVGMGEAYIPQYATGGIAGAGELFRANEKEREMIVPESRFNDLIRAAQSVSGGSRGGKADQVEMRHSGTIRVEGVDDRGQLVEVINVTMKDILRQEARIYG